MLKDQVISNFGIVILSKKSFVWNAHYIQKYYNFGGFGQPLNKFFDKEFLQFWNTYE